jgi:hypothetical protein
MIDDCMQQHIHSTIASFGRTKGTKEPEEGKRERERRRRKEGSREDGEAHGRMMDGKLKLGKNVIRFTLT